MRKKLFSCAVIVICLAMVAFGTLAYFTADNTAHNVITSGNIDIELQEWANADKTVPFPEDGVTGVMPGAQVTKIAEVKNTGDNAAYIRVQVSKSVYLNDQELDAAPVGIEFDTTKWEYRDGFYYYKEALESGAVSEPLFTAVTFANDMSNAYQNSTANVVVKAYAVQVANNGGNVFEAAGWPEVE